MGVSSAALTRSEGGRDQRYEAGWASNSLTELKYFFFFFLKRRKGGGAVSGGDPKKPPSVATHILHPEVETRHVDR